MIHTVKRHRKGASPMISLQFNNTITERDMDLLFAESILTDPGFCNLLLDKTDLKSISFQVLNAEPTENAPTIAAPQPVKILETDANPP
jgi:hypothetical protein